MQPVQVRQMNLTPDKIVLIGAAVAVLFWPQIWPIVQRLMGKATAGGTPAVPVAPVAGPSRSATVTELLALQDIARALGKPAAADLIGQAVVDLVSDAKPAGGRK